MDSSSAYPQFIDPKEELVDGVIVGFDRAPTKFGEADIVRVKPAEGEERSLWLTATVLKSKMARLKPKVGERITVEYLGEREGANATYGDYAVEMPDRPPYVPDWDKLDADAVVEEVEAQWGA